MKLTFRQGFMSIRGFPELELPPFTLITGLNGSGKTHLLNAVKTGAIGTDVAPTPSENVQLFDWTSLVPKDQEQFDSGKLAAERMQEANTFDQLIHGSPRILNSRGIGVHETPDSVVLQAARNFGIAGDNPKALARMSATDLTAAFGGDPEWGRKASAAISDAVQRASDLIRKEMLNTSVERLAAQLGKPIYLIERDDILSGTTPSWGAVGLFQQSFAKLFGTYRDLWLENQNKRRAVEGGRKDVQALSDAEFVERHKREPWNVVNDFLGAAGLDFEIDKPYEFSNINYMPRLMKRSTGAIIPFASLSSGEKILMSFALCLYYAQDGRQTTTYPKILLFDEVDAPLHPSMASQMIKVIREVLVGQYGINVIATTHSASTVALAPEESLYVMKDGMFGLSKTTKAQALNVLTVGVPTLAISYEGRRQVLVESAADAEIYGKIYEILRPALGLDRTLEFVGTGVKDEKGGEKHTGCAVVKALVSSLVEAGTASVFGLLDWDAENEPTERISVLAKGRRNGLENVVFDPLNVAVLIVKDVQQHRELIGVPKDVGYPDFLRWPPERFQAVIEALETAVLGDLPGGERIECQYHGGMVLKLRADYLKMDDHALEARLVEKLVGLKSVSHSKKAGALMLEVAKRVMQDVPAFIPGELVETFKALLTADSHIDKGSEKAAGAGDA